MFDNTIDDDIESVDDDGSIGVDGEGERIEYTLHEAGQLFGFSRRVLSQAITENKLEARLTAGRSGFKENGVPIYVVSDQEMQRFKQIYTPSMLSGVGSSARSRKKESGPRTTEDEAEMFRRRREVEDRAEAKKMGFSYDEYLTFVQ